MFIIYNNTFGKKIQINPFKNNSNIPMIFTKLQAKNVTLVIMIKIKKLQKFAFQMLMLNSFNNLFSHRNFKILIK